MPLRRLLRRMKILPPKPERAREEAGDAQGKVKPYPEDFRHKFSAMLTRFYTIPNQDEEEVVEGCRKNSKED